MHIVGVDQNNDEIEKWVELKLNSVLYSHFSEDDRSGSFWSLSQFSYEMKKMLFDMMRGSQNASEILPNLPFWPNPEKKCVELAARQILHMNGVECRPNCYHVKWEEALYQAFAADCKLVKR